MLNILVVIAYFLYIYFPFTSESTSKGSEGCSVFDDCNLNRDTSKVDISKSDSTWTLRHKVAKDDVNN